MSTIFGICTRCSSHNYAAKMIYGYLCWDCLNRWHNSNASGMVLKLGNDNELSIKVMKMWMEGEIP